MGLGGYYDELVVFLKGRAERVFQGLYIVAFLGYAKLLDKGGQILLTGLDVGDVPVFLFFCLAISSDVRQISTISPSAISNAFLISAIWPS